jgi:hypothetical protein
MGIRGFFDVFKPTGTITLKQLAGKQVGIDAMMDIHRAERANPRAGRLIGADGRSTMAHKTILSTVASMAKHDIKIIYVFDNPEPNPIKAAENERRHEAKGPDDGIEIDAALIGEIQTMLSLLGVRWIVAPAGSEAEQIGAHLTRHGALDYFLTGDSDALTFGAARLLRRTNKTSVFDVYEHAALLAHHALTNEEFVHVCCVAGSDFAPKTPGIGPKTLLTRGRITPLTPEQQTAYNYFVSEPLMASIERRGGQSTANHVALTAWLTGEKSFSLKTVETALKALPQVPQPPPAPAAPP